jgi:hypothetical protein
MLIDGVERGYWKPRANEVQVGLDVMVDSMNDLLGLCAECGGVHMALGQWDYHTDQGVTVQNVPILVCHDCGQRTLVAEVKGAVDAITRHLLAGSVIAFDAL